MVVVKSNTCLAQQEQHRDDVAQLSTDISKLTGLLFQRQSILKENLQVQATIIYKYISKKPMCLYLVASKKLQEICRHNVLRHEIQLL